MLIKNQKKSAWFVIGYPKNSLPRLEADILFSKEVNGQIKTHFTNVQEVTSGSDLLMFPEGLTRSKGEIIPKGETVVIMSPKDKEGSFLCLDTFGRLLYLKKEWLDAEPKYYHQQVKLNRNVKL